MRTSVVILIFSFGAALPIDVLGDARSGLPFSKVEQIRVGVDGKAEIETRFGKPSKVELLEGGSGEAWEYKRDDSNAFDLFFQGGAGVLSEYVFNVGEEDNERKLATVLPRFPRADWKIKVQSWIHPHMLTDECEFLDAKLGVAIGFRQYRKVVSYIRRWQPSFRNISQLDETPPDYCFARDGKNFCMRGEDFQKRMKFCEPELAAARGTKPDLQKK